MVLFFKKHTFFPLLWQDDKIIRSDLFGSDRLYLHAKNLAEAHKDLLPAQRDNALTERLKDNARILLSSNIRLSQASLAGEEITPAAEWFIDNYYFIDAQIQNIKLDFSYKSYKELPKLSTGTFTPLPRIFEIAWAVVAHTDSHIDAKTLCLFLNTYQTKRPLLIREIWAVPIQIKMILIENLRRIAEKICQNLSDREQADQLANIVLASSRPSTTRILKILARTQVEKLNSTFLLQFAHRLRGREPQKDSAFLWLENLLQEKGTDIDRIVHDELQEQSALNATIRNIITSMRLMITLDWSEITEKTSSVSKILYQYDNFSQMDISTRNLYSQSIEILAKGCRHTECDIAQKVVGLAARTSAQNLLGLRRADPGYYLLAEGRHDLEVELEYRAPLRVKLAQLCRIGGIAGYSIIITALSFSIIFMSLFLLHHHLSTYNLLFLFILGFIPTTDAVVAGVNRFLLWALKVSELPALELKHGVPANLRTLVVVPTLLTRRSSIQEMIKRLEKHYLASRDGEIYFALLTDWTDASTQFRQGDWDILDVATQEIARLNQTYPPGTAGVRFLILHRKRQWSTCEGKWIGWERKRGKLHELNRLLRGATDTSFINLSEQTVPQNVKYVVTVDSDTRVPHEVVRRLVGKLAHPLNRAYFDPIKGRVTEGYAILQPRVTPSLPEAWKSTLFQRVFSSPNGIEPYTAAVSDLYQDMFAEGSFAGKGIYEIDSFEAALAGRVPEGTLLSHDLFEGVFARAGLVSDIEVIEDFPTDYLVSVSRLHRWVRGDWQLLPWIFSWMGYCPTIRLKTQPLAGISRWKMLDNLRRSLSAPMAIAALFTGWFLDFRSALIWSLYIFSALAIPALLPLLIDILRHRRGETVLSYLSLFTLNARRAILTIGLNFTFLADQACLMGDAIIRTLGRVFITRRNMLQWITAAQAANAPKEQIPGYFHHMSGAVLLSLAALGTMFVAPHLVWLVILPFALSWCLSPVIAWKASQYSASARRLEATESESLFLRMQARKTWCYFETFVSATNHDLPPALLQNLWWQDSPSESYLVTGRHEQAAACDLSNDELAFL